MKKSIWAYTAVAVLAITGASALLLPNEREGFYRDSTELQALADGDMRKLTWTDGPAVPDLPFQTADGGTATLADYAGKPVVLNFWATWCAPCRTEMPHLAQLAETLGEEATVLTIATGRNDPAAIDRFFAEIGVTDLPKARDPDQSLSRAMGVLGLPATILIAPDGVEVARLLGDADWSSDSAIDIVRGLAN